MQKEISAPRRTSIFGIPVIVDESMPPDRAVMVSHRWDARLGRMVEHDRVTIVNLG